MKLLIITQKVDLNDDVLGFMPGWLLEFARQCEQVTVICLWAGEYHLPTNVKVLSLGKETGVSKIKYLVNFYQYIWRERVNYDYVWVHMNPEYVLLGWPWWRLGGKKIGLWYAHGKVTWKLRLAAKLATVLFTSTPSGFNLASPKLRVIGQGIDVNHFQPASPKPVYDQFKIITVGRISPAKDLATIISAIEILVRDGKIKLTLEILGGAGLPKQEQYLAEIKQLVKDKGLAEIVVFRGAVPNKDILRYLQAADLFINTSQTGSLDKAIVEAMAVGLPIVSSNQAITQELNSDPRFIFASQNVDQLAQKIKFLAELRANQPAEFNRYGQELRQIAVARHSLPALVTKIIKALKN